MIFTVSTIIFIPINSSGFHRIKPASNRLQAISVDDIPEPRRVIIRGGDQQLGVRGKGHLVRPRGVRVGGKKHRKNHRKMLENGHLTIGKCWLNENF